MPHTRKPALHLGRNLEKIVSFRKEMIFDLAIYEFGARWNVLL